MLFVAASFLLLVVTLLNRLLCLAILSLSRKRVLSEPIRGDIKHCPENPPNCVLIEELPCLKEWKTKSESQMIPYISST